MSENILYATRHSSRGTVQACAVWQILPMSKRL